MTNCCGQGDEHLHVVKCRTILKTVSVSEGISNAHLHLCYLFSRFKQSRLFRPHMLIPISCGLLVRTRYINGDTVNITIFYYTYLLLTCGPGSSVGIATELRAGRSGIESRWGRDFRPV